MKRNSFFLLLLLGILFSSCENSRNKKTIKEYFIDYSNKSVLDSLIKAIPHSNDTIFLGFIIGMTKSKYENHIQKLRNEGKTVSYSKSNRFSNMAGTFELGAGYTFKTSISTEISGKTLTGEGQYFLEPVYNNNGNLMKLNILPIEEWNGDYGYYKPNWLVTKIKENSDRFENESLKQALIDNEFIDKDDFIRQKGNLVIYETTVSVNYIDLKTLLLELLIKKTEKEIIKKENKDIKF